MVLVNGVHARVLGRLAHNEFRRQKDFQEILDNTKRLDESIRELTQLCDQCAQERELLFEYARGELDKERVAP